MALTGSPEVSLGSITVTTPGTTVPILTNASAPPSGQYQAAAAISVTASPNNTGNIYLVKGPGAKSLGANPNVSLLVQPGQTLPLGPFGAALNLSNYYLDADIAGEGAALIIAIGAGTRQIGN